MTDLLPTTIYALCAATSALCFAMLWRGYVRTRVKLTMWTALCFAGLTLNNTMLLIDGFIPDIRLADARAVPALLGVAVMVYGLVKEHT